MLMVLISQSMFIVAVPAIRGAYPIEPDSVSWAVIVYTLTFMMFMPTLRASWRCSRQAPFAKWDNGVFLLRVRGVLTFLAVDLTS